MEHYNNIMGRLDAMKSTFKKHLECHKKLDKECKKKDRYHYWPHHELKNNDRTLEDLHDRFHEMNPIIDDSYKGTY
jgi:uncharacterized protein YdcH (DUF465 family)